MPSLPLLSVPSCAVSRCSLLGTTCSRMSSKLPLPVSSRSLLLVYPVLVYSAIQRWSQAVLCSFYRYVPLTFCLSLPASMTRSGGMEANLQGYIVLCGALELASRNITAGAVRIGYSTSHSPLFTCRCILRCGRRSGQADMHRCHLLALPGFRYLDRCRNVPPNYWTGSI